MDDMFLLWILKPRNALPDEINPWRPWYDKTFGFVVSARTEEEARRVAASNASDEGQDAWAKPELSTCEILEATDEAEVIMEDFQGA